MHSTRGRALLPCAARARTRTRTTPAAPRGSDVTTAPLPSLRLLRPPPVRQVRRCTKTRAHDWTECPFTHPGEKARRRDPRRFAYCGTACPDFRKGSCRRGDACEFAHGVFECWLHPARYRTQSCKDGPGCTRRVCFFAHLPGELRAPTDPFGRSASPPSRGAGSSSPTGHPLPHSPSQASSVSPPRSASPPQPADTFAELAAYGLLPPTGGRAAAPPLHGRRVCSMDGGSRPLAPSAAYYGALADPVAAAAAERQLAHLNLAAGQAGMRLGPAAAAAAVAAAAVQQHLVSAQHAGYGPSVLGGHRPQPLCAPPNAMGGMPLNANAAAAAAAAAAGAAAAAASAPGYASVPSLASLPAALAAAQLAQAQLVQHTQLAQQAAALRAVAQQRAAAVALHTHLAAAAAAVALAQQGQEMAAAAAPPAAFAPAAKGAAAALRAAAAAAAFPRPSSFAHLGMIEGVLDMDDEPPPGCGGAPHYGGGAFAWAGPPHQEQQAAWA
jgi:hypothetical protein